MPPDEDFSFPTLSEPSTSSPPQMEVGAQSAASSALSTHSHAESELILKWCAESSHAASYSEACNCSFTTESCTGDGPAQTLPYIFDRGYPTLTCPDTVYALTDATAKAQAAAEAADGERLQSDGLDAHSKGSATSRRCSQWLSCSVKSSYMQPWP